MSRKLFSITLYLMFVLGGFAQDIEVKKFESLEKDQTATLSPRKDINGVTCGLVKVALKEAGAEFEGNVMGDVQFTGSEYLVYMPNGSKRLGIKHPDYLPTTVVFADYGTKKVASATTYELKVKTNKKQAKVDNRKNGMAVFNIKPSNAMLLIDGQVADGTDGAYTMSLPYGTHYYTVKLKDFCINNQMFVVSHDIKTINIDLMSFFAWVSISSTTNDARIYINNELVSIGHWEGFLPPSTYNIELRKEGFHPQSKTIELFENDSMLCKFSEMDIIGGKIRVNYKPDDSNVFIDGKYIGKTPLEYGGVSEGSHKVEIRCENYESASHEIKMLVNQTQLLEGKLQLSDLGYLLTRSKEGDIECQSALGRMYIRNEPGIFKRKDLEYNPSHPYPHLERNLDKAIFWLEQAASAKYDPNNRLWDISHFAKADLSECYILKKDFKKSFYWAVKSNDILLMSLHYYFGLGVQKNKQKCAQILLRWSDFRDDNELKQSAEGNINAPILKECLFRLAEFNGKKEIWNIVKEME